EHGAAANGTVSESMETVASPAGSPCPILVFIAFSGLLSPVTVLVISIGVCTAWTLFASSAHIAFFAFRSGLLSPFVTALVVRVGVLVGTGLAGFGFALFLPTNTFIVVRIAVVISGGTGLAWFGFALFLPATIFIVVRIAVALSVGTRLAFLTLLSSANTTIVIFVIGIGVVITSGGTGPAFLTFPSSTTIRVVVGIGIGAATTATSFPACRRTYLGWVILVRSRDIASTWTIIVVVRSRDILASNWIMIVVVGIGIGADTRFPACRRSTYLRRVIVRVEVRSRDIPASLRIDRAAGLHPEAHSIPRSAANRNALRTTSC
ncbi:MAG: hypothetical protein EBZ67_17040, partial [Chitinophagia bacterium]|nr:hypothetical protein [Chitinophagia bacterium]